MVRISRYYKPATLLRQSSTANTTTAPAYALVGTFRMFIQPNGGGSERSQFNALNEEYTHIAFTDLATPAKYGDRVQQAGVTYRVVGAQQVDGISSVGHHKELQLRYADA